MSSREDWETSGQHHWDSVLMTRGDILSIESENHYYAEHPNEDRAVIDLTKLEWWIEASDVD